MLTPARRSIDTVSKSTRRTIWNVVIVVGVLAAGSTFVVWQTRSLERHERPVSAHTGPQPGNDAAAAIDLALPDPSSDPAPSAAPFGSVLTPDKASRLSIAELEALVAKDPAAALLGFDTRTAKNDAEAERLAVIEVKALVGIGRMGPARARAAAYYERWPDGPDIAELERLTGQHPTKRTP